MNNTFFNNLQGKIWSLTPTHEAWDGENLIIEDTLCPLEFLVIKDPIPVGVGEIIRAMPVSPLQEWPREWHAPEDMIVFDAFGASAWADEPTQYWVVHTWLNYPVLVRDMGEQVGEIDPIDFDNLFKKIAELNADDSACHVEESERIYELRGELVDNAAYLSASLHARRLQQEEQP